MSLFGVLEDITSPLICKYNNPMEKRRIENISGSKVNLHIILERILT